MKYRRNARKVDKVLEYDWVTLRLLYLLISDDISNIQIPDVIRSLNYLKYKRNINVDECFSLINKDHAEKGTLSNNPESNMIRNLDKQREHIQRTIAPSKAEFNERGMKIYWRMTDE